MSAVVREFQTAVRDRYMLCQASGDCQQMSGGSQTGVRQVSSHRRVSEVSRDCRAVSGSRQSRLLVY